MSSTNIDPRWADIDFDKVNAELRDLRAQVGRLQAHIDRTQPVVAGADGYVQPQAQEPVESEYKRGFNDGMNEAPTGDCWIRAVDEAMVGAHLGVADMADDYGTAKKKLNDLICWHVEVAQEPAPKQAEPVEIEHFGLEPWERDKPTSPTAGMNIAQRIRHVGGRNNQAGYVEFGSIQAVEALVRQVLRDLPAQGGTNA